MSVRTLVAVFGSFGVAVGLICAVVARYLPFERVGWFSSTPPTSGAYSSTLTLTLNFDWFPSIVVLPGIGLVLGIVVALVLYRARWSLRRG